jgi:hypothetical protein
MELPFYFVHMVKSAPGNGLGASPTLELIEHSFY